MQYYRSYFTCILAFSFLLLSSSLSLSQSLQTTEDQAFWQDASEAERAPNESRIINPTKSRLLELNPGVLSRKLSSIGANTSFEILLPMPDGQDERFLIEEYSMMESGLAAAFPQLKTYQGKAVNHPEWTIKLDLTTKGFHGMIYGNNFTAFIDPYSSSVPDQYVSYFKSDYSISESYLEIDPFEVQHEHTLEPENDGIETDGNLRTYRIAIAATGEYTAFHGGSVNDAMSAITTTMNRVNGIYERDFAVRMILVNNNNQLIFTDGTTDPFSNNNTGALIGESQANIDAIIGTANYDIGHTFSTGGGGLAGLGVVCFDGYKGQGVTGRSNPIGDPFDVDFVAHEIGHQFGAAHTFNGNAGSCGGNRSAATAYEPGSGSTIMAYAGICGSQNLQNYSDPYFHSGSLHQVHTYTTIGWGGSCASMTSTGNNAPTVDAGPDYTIPRQTPFKLDGSANDPDGDALTYSWEQIDLGGAGSIDDPTNNDGPIFRTFSPTNEPSRTFPQLSDILSNTQTRGEILSQVNRDLTFQLTVRDNQNGGGRYGVDTTIISVRQQAGPFRITAPNASNINWAGNSSQNVSWDVAGTASNPINCSQVNILLSTDGGQTFPHVLASNTANDGSALIQVPNVNSTSVRIKIEAVGNIFFDISDQNFRIVQGISEPTLANPVFNSVTANEAIMGAELVSDGGATVTERGVIWSENPNPIVGNGGTFKVVEGNTNLGNFTVNETNLPSGSTIYFRGYAINSQGVGYTQDETFQTELGKPIVRFKNLNYTVGEEQATGPDCERVFNLDIEVEITDAPSADLNVGVIIGGNAQQVQDFLLVSTNPIVFPAGSNNNQIVQIQIIDDASQEPNEQLTVTLAPTDTNLAAAGGPATININDDDLPPGLNTPVAANLGVSIAQPIGPLATVHFYDEITGELMATIQNHSNYDFGCTWVEMDRIGNGTVPFWEDLPDNRHDLMEKTLFIHPENNQPTNDYTVTLYYTQDEVDGWINATGGQFVWDSLQMALSPGNISNITPDQPEPDGSVIIAEAQSEGFIGQGYGVSARFSTPMGGFGVGKVGVQGNLVNFIELNGYHNFLDKKNYLEWKTKGESNVVQYNLERITPDSTVKTIKAKVAAAGNSSETETYGYQDKFEPEPFVQYLVKAEFEDGSFAFSDTLTIEPEELVANVYPNPFSDKLNVYVEGQGDAIVTVTSATVSLLHRYSWNLTETNLIEIELERLAPGLYFYSIVNEGRIKGGTLVKMR